MVDSPYGHDAFLVEVAQMRPAIRSLLKSLESPAPPSDLLREAATDARRLAALRFRR